LSAGKTTKIAFSWSETGEIVVKTALYIRHLQIRYVADHGISPAINEFEPPQQSNNH
jgi:hypothetical protein